MRGFTIAVQHDRSSRVPAPPSAGPSRGLESVVHREPARRSAEIAINSFDFPPRDAPAHAREHPTSVAARG
jgi:hypothetical protein